MHWNVNRRSLLKTSAALAATAAFSGLAGRSAMAADKLEIFSWWTSGGESAALQTLIDGFKEHYPSTEITNAAVAGGGGTNALPVLQARLAGGTPPDTWQGNSGTAFFNSYADPGYIDDVTDLYKSEGWEKTMSPGVLDLVRKNGKYYAVMVGAHRCNEVWFNKPLLAKNGIEIGDSLSFDQFFAAAEKLRAAGVNALAVGDNGIWANMRMLENTFNGVLGYEQTVQLWDGKLAFNSPQMKEAYKIHLRMLDYQNPDHSALSWDQAVKKVIEGSSAFTMMGDWSYGEFAKAGAKDGVDFGWVSHPGTEDIFIIVTDGFPIAKDAPNPESARNWLKVMGDPKVQLAFSLKKGSVATRLDVDKSTLPPYLQWSFEKFAKNKFTGSSVNGEQVPPSFNQSSFDALTTFVVDKNIDAFADNMQAAFDAIPKT
ncbi:carbohydrate ABC transporter substrate-binding protein [Mesorhizobium sp. B2-5-13]|uniref:ABC transporter substrate-binding protein n=1 Tax=unclassified Mesorhizobium TaxID=325217 RepID=UPI001127F3B3|nr:MULTISPECIES: ABC transporter substrate-binding protein [unclassified Mesorhizobium]TPJ88174.1 carbohydrate ABC transporter substrate-binding protein [Mesorhizobium sp. B2-5-13]TPK52369.1 carbohydrate ABC transporter substrate-binding protein [Mesorhizobium sp. B2-5-5]